MRSASQTSAFGSRQGEEPTVYNAFFAVKFRPFALVGLGGGKSDAGSALSASVRPVMQQGPSPARRRRLGYECYAAAELTLTSLYVRA